MILYLQWVCLLGPLRAQASAAALLQSTALNDAPLWDILSAEENCHTKSHPSRVACIQWQLCQRYKIPASLFQSETTLKVHPKFKAGIAWRLFWDHITAQFLPYRQREKLGSRLHWLPHKSRYGKLSPVNSLHENLDPSLFLREPNLE